MTAIQYEKLDLADLRERFDELTRASVGLSGDEFIARARSQRLDMTSPLVSKLAMFARMIEQASASAKHAA